MLFLLCLNEKAMSLLKEILVLPYSAEIHQAYAHSEIAFSRGPEPVVIALGVWFTPLEYTKAVVLEIGCPYSTNIEKNLKIAVGIQARQTIAGEK